MIGTSIGTYRITAKLGAGGMGEVYRATDTKLKRDVALKVLPEAFERDPERLARFEREAEVLASLNHPNIAAIYGVVEDRALVMELVEGSAPRGPLPFDDAWAIMSQVAAALDYAHEKGVVHRDLKPANIKVTPDGQVKLLDFGLAKAFSNQPDAAANPENSPTLTIGATQVGVILGTAAYMSPEQAKGKTVDKRADIWAFGVVLYELLSGERLFKGEDVSETLAQVLTKEPDLNKVPVKVRKLLGRCLEKDPKKRLRDVGEVGWLLESDEPTAAAESRGETNRWIWPSIAAVCAIAALALSLVAYRHVTEEIRIVKLPLLPPEKAEFTSVPAVSPDGRWVVFAASGDKNELWVRGLDSPAARALPGTEGATLPFWSPDSRTLGFFAGRKLKKIDVAGGPALTLADAGNARGGSWSRKGVIVFAPNVGTGLFRISAAGGTATPLTTLDKAAGENAHRNPWFLPDGHDFLYTARNDTIERNTVYVADVDSSENTRGRRAVIAASSNAVFAQPGYLLFLRERTLMAQPFDADKARTTGDAVPIAEQIDFDSLNITGSFGASQNPAQNAVLVYTSGGSGGNPQLTWFDRSGKALGTVGPRAEMDWPAISPDGNTVAYDFLDAQTANWDIWLHDLVRGTDSRFTFNSKSNRFPVWSPDGSHIAFLESFDAGAYSGRGYRPYQKPANGLGGEEAVDTQEPYKRVDDCSRDGRYIIEETPPATPKTGPDIWVLPLFGDRKPFPYLQTESNEQFAKLSPDGHWLAYQSNETKRNEVYVQTFPKPGGKWQISTGGGFRPVWSRDGKELFFIAPDFKMMAVDIKGGPQFQAGVPKPLFDVRFTFYANASFDVSKDGRFLIPVTAPPTANVPMTVVLNWQAALKK